MFSLDNFYYIVSQNFLHPVNIPSAWFIPFGATSPSNLYAEKFIQEYKSLAIFYDQEPIYSDTFNRLLLSNFQYSSSKYIKILVNSEHSELKNNICDQSHFYDWYYFFHGLAALEWYRDHKYYPNIDPGFTKVFISLNRLISEDRSYRLTLVSHLLKEHLMDHGIVSCQLEDHLGSWRDEIFSPTSKLSTKSRLLVHEQFKNLSKPFIVDESVPNGELSANLNYALQQEAFIHLVSETIFYEEKLHLTEKVFKPIIARRPFMLVAAPGNLAYIKSYGFKTFDRWIDESYDSEKDPDIRIEKIVKELTRLCNMSKEELDNMYREMLPTLEYNFNHFYGGDFQTFVVHEMVENFENVLKKINVGKLPQKQIDTSRFNAQDVIKRLNQ